MGNDLKHFANSRVVPPDATLTKQLVEAVERGGDARAIEAIGSDGVLQGSTYNQVLTTVKQVVAALDASGIKRGDRVAILSGNRPEWSLADYGCLAARVVVVPIYPTLTAAQVGYVLRDSGSRLAFVEDGSQARKVIESGADLAQVVCFDPDSLAGDSNGPTPAHGQSAEGTPGEGVVSWTDFLASENRSPDLSDADLRKQLLAVAPEDVATIIYTSGTTGDPKGVVLTHHNIASNVHASSEAITLDASDNTLSILPLSHVFQRMVNYLCFWRGCRIAYPRSVPETVMEDLKIVAPTMVAAVPRIYERVHAGVVSATGLKGKLVHWALGVAERAAALRLAGGGPGAALALKYRLADKLVYSKVRAAVGGRIRLFISGGGPLAPELNRFFHSIGFSLLEGYGLTETSPVTNVNSREHLRIGSVGRPVPATEIRIADDGEIEIHGPQVMRGYHNRPEATERAIDSEGWFATGDIGRIDSDGFLYITDRKKDIIVTAGGKNVAPQPIENRIKMNAFVEQVVMLGDERPYCIALIVPAFPALVAWAEERGIAAADAAALASHPRAVEHVYKEVLSMCTEMASFETPKRIALLGEELTVENGYLTPTMKVKRKMVTESFGSLIDSLYAE